jgi:H+/gluconate symporter-like permease
MPLIIVAIGIVILLLLMTYVKLNAFFSLLKTSFWWVYLMPWVWIRFYTLF